MSSQGWQPWQVPPFSSIISREDQELCREAQHHLTLITHRVLIPCAAHITMLLDAVLVDRGTLVKPHGYS
jgi:hypothetical protein